MKLWDQAGRGQNIASLRFIHSRGSTSPSTASSLLSITLPTLPSATSRKSQPSSYPHSSCFALPFFFIKLSKQQSVARYPACWPS